MVLRYFVFVLAFQLMRIADGMPEKVKQAMALDVTGAASFVAFELPLAQC